MVFDQIRRFLLGLHYRKLYEREVDLGWRGKVKFSLHRNAETGKEYAMMQAGAEGPLRFSKGELATVIQGAQTIHDQMR